MMLDIRNALKNPGQSYPLRAEISLPPMDVLSDEIAFEGVVLKGEFVGAGESVKIIGVCRATVAAHCALCLDELRESIEADVAEVFAKNPDASDPDQYPLSGYEIELDDIAKDALLLALPLRFLCKDDCLGLCPVCGQNLNHELCTCHEGHAQKHPLEALSGLLNEDEEV